MKANQVIQGNYVCLEPISQSKHSLQLYYNLKFEECWEFFHGYPCTELSRFKYYIQDLQSQKHRNIFNYAICSSQNRAQALGFLGIDIKQKNQFEVVNVMFSPKLQRTTKATEAFFILAQYCFEVLGCQTLSWFCDLKNMKSKRAAERYGFYYEGETPDRGDAKYYHTFTMTKMEWETRSNQFKRWLSPKNFDSGGLQLSKLSFESK